MTARIPMPSAAEIMPAVSAGFGYSEFVAQACIRSPALLVDLIQSGDLSRATNQVNLPTGSCVPNGSAGPDLFYSVQLPAGKFRASISGGRRKIASTLSNRSKGCAPGKRSMWKNACAFMVTIMNLTT